MKKIKMLKMSEMKKTLYILGLRKVKRKKGRKALAGNVEKFVLSYRLPRLKTSTDCYLGRGLC